MKWQGRNNMVEYIRNNPFFMMELEDRLRGKEIEAPTGEPELEDAYIVDEAEKPVTE